MIETKQINAVVRRLLDCLPSGLVQAPKDIEKNFQQTIKNALSKMDLVTREEFDAQAKVLTRTREKLEKLEEVLEKLEAEKS